LDDLTWLPWYIHRNSLHHRETTDWQLFPWSSFRHYLAPQQAPSFLNTSFLLAHFGGLQQMLAHHQSASSAWQEHEPV
jgi:hypothetical protein